MWTSVVLPAPFSPSSACTSPRLTVRSTASFATTPGKRLVTARISRTGGGALGRTTGREEPSEPSEDGTAQAYGTVCRHSRSDGAWFGHRLRRRLNLIARG